MSLLTYLIYPVRSITRNRIRSLYAVIGIVLAISFFSGSFIAVDSSAYAILHSRIDQIGADFEGVSYNGPVNQTQIDAAAATLGSVANIVGVTPVLSLEGWAANKANSSQGYYTPSYGPYGGGSLLFLPQNSTKLLQSYRINGSMPAPGTVAISRSTATQTGVAVGDDLNISMSRYSYEYVNGTEITNVTFLNLTYEVSQIWTTNGPVSYPNSGPIGPLFGLVHGEGQARTLSDDIYMIRSDPVILNRQDLQPVIDAMTAFQSPAYPSVTYEIWIDRDKAISPVDIQGSIQRLAFIENRLNYKAQGYGITQITDNIGSILSGMSASMESNKVLFLALSGPVILLGAYLSIVGIDLATSDRRREIGIIKARGGRKRQIIGEMVVESVILGTIAAVFGLLGGLFLSRFMMGVSTSFLGATSNSSYLGSFVVDPSTLITAVFFGIELMAMASYIPMKRLLKTDVAEAIRFFAPSEARKEYSPKWDIGMLLLSAAGIFSAIAIAEQWFQADYSSSMTFLLYMIIALLGVGIIPFLPIFLSVSVIRLLTRGPRRIYTRLAALVKPLTKELHYLVEVNIERNPKRSSMMCMIIALAVAFGLFTSVTMESTLAYQIELVKNQTGADINAVGSWYYGNGPPNGTTLNLSRLDELNSSPDIEGMCRYEHLSAEGGLPYILSQFAMFDPGSYAETVKPADFWFVGSDSSMLDKLEQGGNALVLESIASQYSILVGDVFKTSMSFHQEAQPDLTVNVDIKIVGIVKGLPGLSVYDSLFVGRNTLASVPDGLILNDTLGSSVGILADLKEGSNHTAVSDRFQAALEGAGLASVFVMDQAAFIEQIKQDPYYGALTQFFETEYAISMAIMTVGVAIIIFVTVSERRQEIACIMARGSSDKQMGKILMGESITLMILGLVVGTAVGLVTAFLFNYTMASLSHQLGHGIVMTYVSLSILVVAIASMLTASFLTTLRAGRIKLAEILRIRGG